jgi:hypothetical protein
MVSPSDAQPTDVAALNEALNAAATKFDAQSCRELLGRGADAKHVFRTNVNDWYDGDSSTCLYNAVSAFYELEPPQKEASQQRYVETAAVLLEAGADAAFSAQRGNWNRASSYPLMDRATKTIGQLSDAELKKRLLKAFVKAGVELNARTERGKQGNFGGYGSQEYSLFSIVTGLTPGSDLGLLAVYLDAGVDVNCSKSSWEVEFDDSDDEGDASEVKVPRKSHKTLLHAAIQTANAELVQLLVAHGADVNQNMVFTSGRRYYLMSCLQLAMEIGSGDVLEVLRAAGAQEQVEAKLADTVRMFYRFGNFEANLVKYHEGGEGKWAELGGRDSDDSDEDGDGGSSIKKGKKKKGKKTAQRAASPTKGKKGKKKK